ncbi:MAG TPA: hypothetical protein VGB12_05905 [bacterium]|jgi:hypothetical protein
MPFARNVLPRWSLVAGLAILGAGGAQAALIATPGNDITGLNITLTLTPESDAEGGTTTLSYEVGLATDAAAEWLIVGFTVLRDWTEGPYTGSPAVGGPDGWAVGPTSHFVHWDVHTGAVEIGEDESLAGFTYTFFGESPTNQLFRYLVSKGGATPFQVLSNERTLAPAVVIPEPNAAMLVGLPLAGLLYRRRV